MICLIPVGSPIVYVNHTACCSLALTWHAALLVLMGPTGTLCRTLVIPQSDLLPTRVSWLGGWLHVESWAGVWSSCGGHCPGMLSICIPGHKLSLLATGAGSARIGCCPAVQQRICRVPLPLVQHEPLWAAGLPPGRGNGKGFRLQGWQAVNAFDLAALPAKGQLFLGKQAQMPCCTPLSSLVMLSIALGARGGLRIKAMVPNSLFLLYLFAA